MEEVARRGEALMTRELGATDAVSLVCGSMVFCRYDLIRTENGITIITPPLGTTYHRSPLCRDLEIPE